jgi:ribosomal protein L12E/L44/L45/RPP1/RPP2
MNDKTKLAEAVRTACLEAALRAYEDAGISGLCEEGRWECAVQAIKGVDLTSLIKQAARSPDRNT